MARYAQRLKDQAVARLLPPESASVDRVAQELGIGGHFGALAGRGVRDCKNRANLDGHGTPGSRDRHGRAR